MGKARIWLTRLNRTFLMPCKIDRYERTLNTFGWQRIETFVVDPYRLGWSLLKGSRLLNWAADMWVDKRYLNYPLQAPPLQKNKKKSNFIKSKITFRWKWNFKYVKILFVKWNQPRYWKHEKHLIGKSLLANSQDSFRGFGFNPKGSEHNPSFMY